MTLSAASLCPTSPSATVLAAESKPEPTKKSADAAPPATATATSAPTGAPTATVTPTAVPDGKRAGSGAKATAQPSPTATETGSSAAANGAPPQAAPSSMAPTPTADAPGGPAEGSPTPTPTPVPPLSPVEDAIAALTVIPGATATPGEGSADPEIATATPTRSPSATPTATPRPTRSALLGRNRDGLSLHVMQYLPLILGAADEVGVDPAVLAAFMETEGSGEDAVSPAGALGVMQLMPDKLAVDDDPFDPGTNILRAAQLVRRLDARWGGDLAAMAGAYFGAVDGDGRITEDTDGFATGLEYVTAFAEAYQRWAIALDQTPRTIAIRPSIRRRPAPTPAAADELADGNVLDAPERDRWYLDLLDPQPVIPPIFA